MGAGKTFQIYMPGGLVDSFRQRADDEAQGNESGYVQELHRQHLSSTPSKQINTSAIIDLARVFHPTLAPALELQLNKHTKDDRTVNQPRVIARLLDALNQALEGNLDPEKELALVDRAKAKEWEQTGDRRLTAVAAELAGLLNKAGGGELLKLAEAQTHQLNEEDARKKAKPIISPADEEIEMDRRRRAAKGESSDAHAKQYRKPRGLTPG